MCWCFYNLTNAINLVHVSIGQNLPPTPSINTLPACLPFSSITLLHFRNLTRKPNNEKGESDFRERGAAKKKQICRDSQHGGYYRGEILWSRSAGSLRQPRRRTLSKRMTFFFPKCPPSITLLRLTKGPPPARSWPSARRISALLCSNPTTKPWVRVTLDHFSHPHFVVFCELITSII